MSDPLAVVPEVDAATALEALVDWCGRGFDGDNCPICFGTTPDCIDAIEIDNCEHGHDCPWLAVLKVVT